MPGLPLPRRCPAFACFLVWALLPAILVGCSSADEQGHGSPGTGGEGTGGAAGAGRGSGASGGGDVRPDTQHGTCDGLAEVDVFEDITPPGIFPLIDDELGVLQVRVDPVRTGTVYVGTEARGLFKSTDCGANWTKINTGRHGGTLDAGLLWVMVVDPIEPDVLYIGSLYSFVGDHSLELFKSLNAGVDWDPVFTNDVTDHVGFFQEVAMDPGDHEHLVVTFHEECEKPGFGGGCVGETTDWGKSWTLRRSPFGFGEGNAPVVLGPTSWLLRTPQDGVYCTVDSGETYHDAGLPGLSSIYKAADGVYYGASSQGIYSTKDPTHWKPHSDQNGNSIVGDGERMFVGIRFAEDGADKYFTSKEGEGTAWKAYAAGNSIEGTEVANVAYDEDHHVLYSANARGGLFRVRTR